MTNNVVVVFFLGLVRFSGACEVTSTGVNLFGPDCQYECHCVDGQVCDVDTGECTESCAPGWCGPGCQFRDFAYKELSRQNSNMAVHQYAPNGNDGNSRTCSYTNNASQSATEPWWRVWLPRNETIYELNILTNDDGMGYLTSFTIMVQYVPWTQRNNNEYTPSYLNKCYQTTTTLTKSKTIHVLCGKQLIGNQIRIQLNKNNAQLVLCDVRINGGCSPNKCGYGCTEECHCKGLETSENKISGICSTGCDSKWTGTNGKCNIECDNNHWGETCPNKCGACKDSNCDVITGKCPNGCQIGYSDTDMCKEECATNTWGEACSNECGACKDSTCDVKTGTCPNGCQIGYYETDLCTKECGYGMYGSNCDEECGYCRKNTSCDKVTGICPSGCIDGYIGDTCDQVESKFQGNTITIAGSVVAGIIVICITVIIIVCTIMRRNQSIRNTDTENHDEHINDPTSLPYEDLQRNCIQNDNEGTYESIVREEISM